MASEKSNVCRGGADSAVARYQNRGTVYDLPNEILQDVWEALPPIDRLSISQTCRSWRCLALATPRLWAHVVVIGKAERTHWPSRTLRPGASSSLRQANHTAASSAEPTANVSLKSPASPPGHQHFHDSDEDSLSISSLESQDQFFNFLSTNLRLLPEIYLRSKQLPLDLTIVWDNQFWVPENFYDDLAPHCHRLSRMHFSVGVSGGIKRLLQCAGSLPALRILTAGFDDDDIQYSRLPAHQSQSGAFPALVQVHFGATIANDFIDWTRLNLPGVTELTLTPRNFAGISAGLSACRNLVHLTLVMSEFGFHSRDVASSSLAQVAARIPALSLKDIPYSLDDFVLRTLDNARPRSLTLDYQGRLITALPASSPLYLTLPSPCNALSSPVNIAVRLRHGHKHGTHEVDVVDTSPWNRRRKFLLDRPAKPEFGLWEGFLRSLAVASAAVDALAWDYFISGMPDDCTIAELTITVSRDPAELNPISLARIFGLRKLSIVVQQKGLIFAPDALPDLVRSRPDADSLIDVLSLSPNANFGDDESLSRLARTVLH